jgi:transposase-like protein
MKLFAHFLNELTAQAFLELHIWPGGPVCPHCGEKHRLGRLNGATTSPGSFKCYACRKRFNLRHDTILENCHIPLHVWLRAIYLLAASGQHWGAQRLSRCLGISVRTAWHLKLKVLKASAYHTGDIAFDETQFGHQRLCCDIAAKEFALGADSHEEEYMAEHEAGRMTPELHHEHAPRINLRAKMFEEAAAQLPATGAEQRFVDLLKSVIRFSPDMTRPLQQVEVETQFLLWDRLEP